ncbi:MAG: NADH-ubiquinone oxidoreductase-F iron-sulfur binding region domain-containing protein [Acidimicrobiia bacterium]
MATDTWAARADSPPAANAPHFSRLLPPDAKRTLADHLDWYGALPATTPALIGEVERAKLRGKGGARFPTATKLAVVASRRRAVAVANGTEGEPASTKDLVLMSQAPHLVLDGAVVAAEIVGASEVILCIKRGSVVQPLLERALAERHASGYDTVPIRVVGAPNRYVSGEETAIVNWLNGNDAKPTFVPPRPFERGVAGRPTLVQNVETLSDLALISRFGADWYRAAGTPEDPGTTLVTLSGGVDKPGVCEIPFGVRIGDLLRVAGTDCADLSGVLVGGYFGAWLPATAAADVRLGVDDLKRVGGGLGAGVVVGMPNRNVCALLELARATRWLADQNAGQCGPCVNGLDAIAGAMAELVAGDRNNKAEAHVTRWLGMMEGRGACKHPDGVTRFVSSGLRVFADEIVRHRRHGPCPERGVQILPTPRTGGWR